jgi:alanine racemase
MRLQLKKAINHCIVVNDSYSADLDSLGIALNFLDQQSSGLKKSVILSDFLQSAVSDERLYELVVEKLKEHAVYRLVTIGKRISSALQKLGPVGITIESFERTEDFISQFLSSWFREEAILVKGARVFEFERIVQLLELKAHQTVLEVNLSAIAYNLSQYRNRLNASTKVMGMVKAFAYGSGGAEIASILQFHKADYLGVAYTDEGVDLRKAGIRLPIMVMNAEPYAFDKLIEHNLEPELYSFPLLDAFEQHLRKENTSQYPVHIEMETGMNRLGFSLNEVDRLAEMIIASDSFVVRSVFSHFAASDEPGQDSFTLEQFELFRNSAEKLERLLGYPLIKHIANSAAAIRHPELQMDMVRLGIGLYGIDSSGEHQSELQPVATLRSTIAQIKRVSKGETVSYNRKGVVSRDTTIATIRLGYADGYPRRLGNGIGKVFIKDQFAPVIGTVCMDMFMVDITGIKDVKEGDDVIVFGRELPVLQVAEWAGTIPYEIMTGISQRVRRVYYEE